MTTLSSSLETLVNSLVPSSRNDQRLRHELLSQCQDILNRLGDFSLVVSGHPSHQANSHIGGGRDNDLSQLVDVVKKHCERFRGIGGLF